MTLAIEINAIRAEIFSGSRPLILYVRREFLLVDTLKEARKKKFSPKKKIKVTVNQFLFCCCMPI